MCCESCAKFGHCHSRTVLHVHPKLEPLRPNPHYHFCHERVEECEFACQGCGRLIAELARLQQPHFRYGCCHLCADYSKCDFVAKHRAMYVPEVRLEAAEPERPVEIHGPGVADAHSSPLRSSPRAVRILAVDEDPNLLNEIDRIFRQSPQLFSVKTVANGPLAVKVFHDFQPHVVLLDAAMPSPGGLELCRTIRNSPQKATTHIVALLHKSDQNLIGVANDYGIDLCLNRAASPETIKYEVWRLAQSAGAPARPAPPSAATRSYQALRSAVRRHDGHPTAPAP